MVPQESGQLLPVGGILVDAELQILAELFVELLEGVFVLGQFVEEFHAFLDQIFADDFEDLVLLEHLTGNVQGKIFGIHDSLDEVQVLGDQLFAVVHDEDTTDVQLDVVLLLLVFEQVEGSPLGDKKEGTELQLTFNAEVLDGQVFFPIVSQGLVEFAVFFLGNVVGVASPDGLGFVQLFILDVFFL